MTEGQAAKSKQGYGRRAGRGGCGEGAMRPEWPDRIASAT